MFSCDHQTVKISQHGGFMHHDCADCSHPLKRTARAVPQPLPSTAKLFGIETARFLGVGAFCASMVLLAAGFGG